ncbi:MAG TPA: GNAT family N-acetyltransferase, partial [Isosphaeraceae bacterium]|nr:GNAT family N-acetyltransferase [Isosphaeraceae bacterium]
GVSNLRHALTDKLRREGGHVGYGVRPSRRGQGLATAMLALTLEKARALGIDRVLITCGKENVSSAKVIRKNGGRLLIAQARHEGFQLVSRDPHIPRYGVPHVVA